MAKAKAKPKRKGAKPKRATSHSDFAGNGADDNQLQTLVADAEAKNRKSEKKIPRSLIEHHVKQIVTAQAVCDQAKANAASKRKILTNKFKAAAIDGIDVDALKDAFKIAAKPMPEVITHQRHVGEYLPLIEGPSSELGHQWSMFDSPAVDVKAQGEHAGRNGEHRDTNPHKPGTEARVLWDEGHAIGQSAIAAGIGKADVGAGEGLPN